MLVFAIAIGRPKGEEGASEAFSLIGVSIRVQRGSLVIVGLERESETLISA